MYIQKILVIELGKIGPRQNLSYRFRERKLFQMVKYVQLAIHKLNIPFYKVSMDIRKGHKNHIPTNLQNSNEKQPNEKRTGCIKICEWSARLAVIRMNVSQIFR